MGGHRFINPSSAGGYCSSSDYNESKRDECDQPKPNEKKEEKPKTDVKIKSSNYQGRRQGSLNKKIKFKCIWDEEDGRPSSEHPSLAHIRETYPNDFPTHSSIKHFRDGRNNFYTHPTLAHLTIEKY